MNLEEDDYGTVSVTDATDYSFGLLREHRPLLHLDHPDVHDFLHCDADRPVPMLDHDDRAFAHRLARRLEPRTEIQHRDDGAADVDQALDVWGRTGEAGGAPEG